MPISLCCNGVLYLSLNLQQHQNLELSAFDHEIIFYFQSKLCGHWGPNGGGSEPSN